MRDEAPGVARLYGTEPERCVGGLRRQYIRDVRALNVLIMQGRGIEHRVLAGCIWSIDVHAKRVPSRMATLMSRSSIMRASLPVPRRYPPTFCNSKRGSD
jgi:hypothetical protein